MSSSRIINTKRNIIFSYIDTLATCIFSFISRSIIIYVLGDKYLGLSSLFASILQVLNMADLGFSGAIIYNMYKPIADGDTPTICALLNFYKKIYRVVAIVVLIIGLAITPFISGLINDESPEDINIYILYVLFLLNTVCSYIFFAYYNALLQALQRLDLTKIAYCVINICQNILQVVVLLVFKNYYLFTIIMILATIAKNVMVRIIANDYYPQYVCEGNISSVIKTDIISRVRGILVCNISSLTYTSFDSIILSTFVGLTSVAIYNNYLIIYTAVNQFVFMIRTSMQASIGDSIAKESLEKNYQDLYLWQFLYSVIAMWGASCLLTIYQPFMELWMGKSLMLSFLNVVLIVMLFYATTVSNAFFLYLGGNGFWWEMRWPYILSTITNIIFNIVLGKIFGTAGIIFSTLFATVIFGNIWQCNIVFKYYFKQSSLKYHIRQISYTIVTFLCCGITYIITDFIRTNIIIEIFLKLIVCSVIACCVAVVVYRNEPIYKDAKLLLKKITKRE